MEAIFSCNFVLLETCVHFYLYSMVVLSNRRLMACAHSREDVRALDIDGVEIHKSFRPGDIVRASVVRALKTMRLPMLFLSELAGCVLVRARCNVVSRLTFFKARVIIHCACRPP
jgi:hypothetical protein